MKGTSSCRVILPMASSALPVSPSAPSSSLTSSGVRNTPSRLDTEALHTAAGTLPRASEVKAMEDCTVAGRAQRNRMPRYSSGVTIGDSAGFSARPSSGNITKVQANTSRCRRQWVMPAMIAWRDSLAPWRKNSRPMPMLVTHSKTTAVWPLQGRKVARRTVAISARVKLSGRKRGRDMGTLCRIGEHMAVFWLPGEPAL